jgi:hypothetical protein
MLIDLLNKIHRSKFTLIGYTNALDISPILSNFDFIELPLFGNVYNYTKSFIRNDDINKILGYSNFNTHKIILNTSFKNILTYKEILKISEILLHKGYNVITIVPMYETISNGISYLSFRDKGLLHRCDLSMSINDNKINIIKDRYSI